MVDNVVSCTRSAKRSEIALHAAEAAGVEGLESTTAESDGGHGFPALHVQGTYVADAESVLLRICDALKREADHDRRRRKHATQRVRMSQRFLRGKPALSLSKVLEGSMAATAIARRDAPSLSR